MKTSKLTPSDTPLSEVEFLRKENDSLQKEISFLNESIDWLKRQLFGKRSEKTAPDSNEEQLYLKGFEPQNETSGDEETITVQYQRKRKPSRTGQNKVKVPPNLPVERVEIDLPESEKKCPTTGKALVKIGEEITRKLSFRPAQYYIKEIARPKYGLPNAEGVVYADLPEGIIGRCLADESLLADVLVRKFVDHMPLYRIEESMKRDGIHIPRQLLSQWVLAAGKALFPLWNKMRQSILASQNIFIDETPIKLLAPGEKKTQTGYMWVIAGGASADPPYRVYSFHRNRQHKNAEKLLKNYKGTFHSDKYGAYEKIAACIKRLWCPCWAHIRRKFFEAQSGDQELKNWVLRKIRYLFMLERVAWARSEEERLRIRSEKEIPIIDELIKRVKDSLTNGKILPKSKLSSALNYFHGLIPYLKNYTKSPWARLDNNVAERAIRPLALGRKNWLFVGSACGGEAAGVVLSLAQTCRALEINPREYLEDVMRRLMSHPINKIEELLPDQWADESKAEKPDSVPLRRSSYS